MGALLVGCAEPTLAPPLASSSDPQAESAEATSHSNGEALDDLKAISRFELTISIDEPLTAGVPVRVGYTATAHLGTARAVLEPQAPDVQLARRTNWQNASPAPRQKVAPVEHLIVSAPANATLRQNAVLTFEKPGFYRLIATATAPDERPLTADGYVNNFAYKEIWVLVTEKGGQVLPEFDRSVFGDSLQVAPGPFRRRGRTQPGDTSSGTTAHRSLSPSTSATRTTIPNTINGYVLY